MRVKRGKIFKSIFGLGLIFAFCLFTFAFFSFPKVSAHRFYTSLTRIDYNAGEKNIEITIQVFTHDLVEVLEKINKKPLELEKSGESDKLILSYLEEKFVLQDKNGQNRKLKWVGKEFKTDSTFIYVEIPSEEGIEKNKL
ncbi:MAG TPA: DUF6702 family protein, partial [Pyrinomonadaceae bacterium]|nr:DUF6702 family protein [Pyrinomonadaceae bacterium]